MNIIVNHLTRMRNGRICVAGIDQGTLLHVRPVLGGSLQLTTTHLLGNGGIFDIGVLVDLGPVSPVGRPPELEDYQFDLNNAEPVDDMPSDDFWNLLTEIARTRLLDVFGLALHRTEHSWVVDPECGSASLGCLVPSNRPELYVNKHEQIRLKFSEGPEQVFASVTDLRFYAADCTTPDRRIVENVRARIARGVPIILGVGLSRPWSQKGSDRQYHWLQVNSIHLADDPLWRVSGLDV